MARVEILDLPVDSVGMRDSVDRIRQFLDSDGFHLVVTLGSEMVMRAQIDPDFRRAVRGASLVVPDGVGVVLAARFGGYQMPEKVAGVELVQRLALQLGPRLRLFLLGGAPGVAEKAADHFRRLSPGLSIVGVRDGYFKDDEEVVSQIASSGANVVLVGLGFPKQELWLEKYGPRLNAKVGIGVGGSFDVLSGRLARAPQWMISFGLEWLHRLLLEPKRWSRALALPRFARKILLGGKRAVRPWESPP